MFFVMEMKRYGSLRGLKTETGMFQSPDLKIYRRTAVSKVLYWES